MAAIKYETDTYIPLSVFLDYSRKLPSTISKNKTKFPLIYNSYCQLKEKVITILAISSTTFSVITCQSPPHEKPMSFQPSLFKVNLYNILSYNPQLPIYGRAA